MRYALQPVNPQGRDLAAISPTGTGKTLSYLLPLFVSLKAPISSGEHAAAAAAAAAPSVGRGVRALVLAPTRELAGQIANECAKLAAGRKWRVVLFSKAAAATLADRAVRDKVGASCSGVRGVRG
jgi:ATP-dependent RNA helicase DDX52/ROK1